MAEALLRPCAAFPCTTLVASGRCDVHRGDPDRQRGSAAARGYDSAWRVCRQRFRAKLIAAGIAPVCGAKLPGAMDTQDSQCQGAGRLVDDAQHRRDHGVGLHTDHIRPHRGDRRLRLDLLNLQLLCFDDHSAKTRREQGNH